MIQDGYDRNGYDEFVRFFNKEATTPTVGIHNSIVDDLFSALPSNDVYGFILELYSKYDTYFGCVFIDTSHRLIVLHEDEVIAGSIDSDYVKSMFILGEKGIEKFYWNTLELVDKYNTNPHYADLQLLTNREFGADINWINYCSIPGTLLPTASGRILANIVQDQIVGSYDVKVDKTPYNIIPMVSMRGEFTQFEIEVTPKITEKFQYVEVGQYLYAPDTTYSRKSIARLMAEGVIHAEL